MADVYENYPEGQLSNDNFADIQRAIGRLVDKLPEEGFAPRLVNLYWVKGEAIMVCHDEQTKDWLAARVPTLVAWEAFRLKLAGLDALPTYKRVAARFLGPAEDMKRYLLQLWRLNRGLNTGHWREYKSEEEKNGVRLVLSIIVDELLAGLNGGGGVYAHGYADDMSSSSGQVHKYSIRAHTMGPSYC
jgi:hypothetical protein